MNCPKLPLWTFLFLFALLPATLIAQTDCEEGNGRLNPNPPQSVSPTDIIQKFATKEAVFKQARDNYTYTQDVTVQTLEGHTVDGEFRETTDITYDDKGNRIENVSFAPQSTLTRVSMSREDFEDIRHKMPFVMTTEDLPQYDILYVGTQQVDEIGTYVFDVAPKRIEKDKRYFQGRIWVDNQDLMPRFVTYREQIDGKYWFPTYTRADDYLHFSNGDVHIRETIKYTNYKRFGSRSRIILKGEVPDEKPK